MVANTNGLSRRELLTWAAAATAGYRSADGTTIAFNPGRYEPEILRWLDRLDRQLSLPLNDQRSRFHHCPSLPKDDVK